MQGTRRMEWGSILPAGYNATDRPPNKIFEGNKSSIRIKKGFSNNPKICIRWTGEGTIEDQDK